MATTSTIKTEMKRPIPLILLAAAILGWIIVIALTISRNNLQADMEAELGSVKADRARIVNELDANEAATGTLDDLQAKLEQTRDDLAQTGKQRDTVQENLKTGQQKLADVKEQATKTAADLDAAKAEIAPIDERLANQRKLIDDADQKTIERTEELATVGKRLKEARSQEAEMQESVSQLSAEMKDLADQASNTEAQVQKARDEEASLQKQLSQARNELAKVSKNREGLEDAVAELSARRQQLATDTSAAQTQRDAVQQKVNDLSKIVSSRADELKQLESRITELQEQGSKTTLARIVGLRPGSYTAGPIGATFEIDGFFTMTPKDGQPMTGQYAIDGSDLTLKDVKEGAKGYSFPMTCEISFEPTGFSLTAPEGSEGGCKELAGKTFVQK